MTCTLLHGKTPITIANRRPAIKNSDIASILVKIAELLELQGEDRYRIAAYREAARQIGNYPESLETLYKEDRLQDISGVGESIAAKIEEYFKTGRITYYEDLQRQVNPKVVELLQVPGLGPRRAQYIHEQLGIDSVASLEKAAATHQLSKLPGIGPKTEEKLLREIGRLKKRTTRLLLSVALPAAEDVVSVLAQNEAVQAIEPAGSIRRRKETIGDIDILVASTNPDEVMKGFTTMPITKEVIAVGPTKSSVLTRDDLQIDIRVVEPSTYGAALQHFTGSREHNIALRQLALSKGLTINEYGIFEVDSGKRLGGETEEDIYRLLGMQFMPPEMRENRGEIEAALRHEIPPLIQQEAIKGDLHVHSDWSDGSASILDMADTAVELGYQYMAICDHSRSLRIAHGLSIEKVKEQQKLIQMLNCKYAPFVILSGIEVDILKDGSIDFPDEILRTFDIVTASIHSAFSQPRDIMTARIIKAIRNPHVDILNHPTGRIIQRREPYEVDLDQVLRVAAQTGTAVEISASPKRLDLNDVWARRAKELGVIMVISTDAHSPSDLDQMRYGIFVARRAWLQEADILNTRPVEQLRAKPLKKSA